MSQSAKFEIDWPAIEKAKKILGISWPVKITRTSSKRWDGIARWHYNHSAKEITVSLTVGKGYNVLKASEIIWHELAHIMQYQRTAGNGSYDFKLKALRRDHKIQRLYSYSNRPCEIEARKWEKMAHELLLVKPISTFTKCDLEDL
jgi:hypothetical protein